MDVNNLHMDWGSVALAAAVVLLGAVDRLLTSWLKHKQRQWEIQDKRDKDALKPLRRRTKPRPPEEEDPQ